MLWFCAFHFSSILFEWKSINEFYWLIIEFYEWLYSFLRGWKSWLPFIIYLHVVWLVSVFCMYFANILHEMRNISHRIICTRWMNERSISPPLVYQMTCSARDRKIWQYSRTNGTEHTCEKERCKYCGRFRQLNHACDSCFNNSVQKKIWTIQCNGW